MKKPTIGARVAQLEADNKIIRDAIRYLIEAHNTHTHNVEWPQLVTVVLGPRVTPANIKVPK